jgi:hypothetical protein
VIDFLPVLDKFFFFSIFLEEFFNLWFFFIVDYLDSVFHVFHVLLNCQEVPLSLFPWDFKNSQMERNWRKLLLEKKKKQLHDCFQVSWVASTTRILCTAGTVCIEPCALSLPPALSAIRRATAPSAATSTVTVASVCCRTAWKEGPRAVCGVKLSDRWDQLVCLFTFIKTFVCCCF